MDYDSRKKLELQVHATCLRGDYDAAATLLIRAFGPKVLAFLVGKTRNQAAAEDVFAIACEKAWRSLPGFQWRGSLHTWFFTVAFRSFLNWRKSNQRYQNQVPLSQVAVLMDEIRSVSSIYVRAAEKSRLHALIRQLSPFEQALLELRHEPMEWKELASVFYQGDDAPSSAELTRLAVALKTRYCSLRKRLVAQMSRGADQARTLPAHSSEPISGLRQRGA